MRRAAFAVLLMASASPLAAQTADPLVAGWENPPEDARPLAYWQWINGNVSEPGIRLDLEWMRRVGMGGMFLFDVGFNSPPVPQYVERRVGFGTPEWRSAVHVAAVEAKRLGLSFGMQSSGGWSVSGDPGVTPEQAMKKLVWSETIVTPGTGAVTLAPLPIASGPFQDYPISERFREPRRGGEVAVIAYRLADGEAPAFEVRGVADPVLLGDGRYDQPVELVPDAAGNATLRFRFARAVAPGAVTLSVDGGAQGAVRDGAGQVRATLPGSAALGAPVRTYALSGAPSRDWVIGFTGLKGPLRVREARFVFGPRIDRFEDKAGYGTQLDYDAIRSAPAKGVGAGDVIDLTNRLRADGSLDWHPASGRWSVLRFGWSLTGRRDTPAPAESLGLEIDKLDAGVVRAYADRFYGRLADAAGPDGRMDIAISDSWEAGAANWSPALLAEFKRLRGYDPLPWFPALAGRIVGSADASERFLADWRRTIADLVSDNHYHVFAEALHARGITYFAEAPGTDLPTIADGIQAKSRVDVPMGEYWYWPEGGAPKPEHVADMREAASAAHLTGKKQVAAEALTTMGDEPWGTGPREWRRSVDRFFAEGVNRVVMHTSAHQPFVDGRRPGITLRQYGQHFTRNDAWAELADGWTGYLSRSSFLLQQGRSVADVAVFYGEGAPVGAPHGYARPSGYDYDFVDLGGLNAMVPKDGRVATPGGASYAVIAFAPGVKRVGVLALRRLAALVEAGAILIAPRPVGPEGLEPGQDAAFAELVTRIWGGGDSAEPRRLGAGWVYAAASVEAVLAGRGIAPDLVSTGGALDWVHRRIEGGDIYFLSNPSAAAFEGSVGLRGSDPSATAELWDAETGTRVAVESRNARGARVVPVRLAGHASRFLVVRRAPVAAAKAIATDDAMPIAGRWTVEFLDGMGAPARTSFDSLRSWAESGDAAVRYYSGRARYSIEFTLPAGTPASGARLDLGAVGDMARVELNGQGLGVVWSKDAQVELGKALHSGSNRLSITVANYWQNRLIGDRQPGAVAQTFATIAPYAAGDALRPSGLIGPVTVRLQK